METIFWICGNPETLLDGSYLRRAGRDCEDAAVEIVDAAAAVLPAAEYGVDSIFQNWHGGRFHQFWDNRGGVAIPRGATDEIRAVADAAVVAMAAKREEIDAREQAADREFWADTLRDDEDCALPEVIADMIGAGREHTRASVIAALNANDPTLLVVADDDV